ncbi:MAG: hypothetical protein HETSPECPRED_008738 [Heterodermia speciosa]|uniref:Carrier domain-containing protein n=1 Tax=Heterodermia speciosa TaxID=116794 RepID=A0A8H3G5T5_9LECA|nr:MAG: hypothetical protein HETSPECPRED_008738 [Heterodermia speciosa]
MDTMSFAQWRDALNPKVQGTLNLYNVLGGSLDFFIMLSSATGLMGSFGQCNYAAGSTFQDAFARSMASKGHPVQSLDLVGVAGAGYVAEHSDSVEFLERQGLRMVELEKLMALLDHAVNKPSSQSPIDSQISLGLGSFRSLEGGRRSDAMFSHIYARQRHKTGTLAKDDVVDVAKALRACKSRTQALELASEGILKKLSQLLAMNSEDLNPSQSILAYGADSLIAAELRNWLVMYLQAQVQTLELLGAASIRDLSATVVSRSNLVPSFVAA